MVEEDEREGGEEEKQEKKGVKRGGGERQRGRKRRGSGRGAVGKVDGFHVLGADVARLRPYIVLDMNTTLSMTSRKKYKKRKNIF